MFTARQLALHAARLASAKGGEGLRVLHLPESSATVFDYAVLVTGRSDRQATTIVEEIFHFCKRHQVPRMPVEGEGGWMLIDCYDVVVHALSTEMRERYDLDRLWPMAREVDWERELKELDDPDRPAAPARKPAARRSTRAKAKPESEPEAKPAPKRRRAAARAPRQQGADADLPATLPPEFEPKPRRRKR